MKNIKIELLHSTPLSICSHAIRTCWNSFNKSDNGGQKDLELIDRIGNKMKHESVKNHIHFTFYIEGITTKTLLALTRHDVGVEFSVMSTRYTTASSVKSGKAKYTESKSEFINKCLQDINNMVNEAVSKNIANDEISLILPQSWQYDLTCTMSLTAVQHFLKLRTTSHAHWDIRDLAYELYNAIPNEYKYLLDDCIIEKEGDIK